MHSIKVVALDPDETTSALNLNKVGNKSINGQDKSKNIYRYDQKMSTQQTQKSAAVSVRESEQSAAFPSHVNIRPEQVQEIKAELLEELQ